jgi:DNA end-binding protein Ku
MRQLADGSSVAADAYGYCGGMAPRSIWNGTITFGLVNVPIKLYSAIESQTVHFSEVHAKDGAQIEHRRICPKEDKEVDYDEVVNGYEVSEDRYVVLEKDEIKAAAGERGKVVHLTDFVDAAEIDPVFFDKTYYVGSREAEDAYRLLFQALRRSGRAGIGRFTFHDREYLVAVRALGDVLALHTMRFHDEVVSPDELDIPSGGRRPSKREVEMAAKLVESLEEDFKPNQYNDTYRASVLDLIKRKAAGKQIDLVAQEEPEHDDLEAALAASLGS